MNRELIEKNINLIYQVLNYSEISCSDFMTVEKYLEQIKNEIKEK